MMTSLPIVASCTELTHIFPDAGAELVAIRDLSLSISPGELVLLVGPSGSGKSTLLAILAGLLRPTRGSTTLCGNDISRLDAEGLARVRRAHVGFVFQSFHLFDALSARDNVTCVLDMQPRSSKNRSRAEQVLDRVGLGQRMHHRPAQLSGGERQRVALARALAVRPKIIFGDEPTSALDAKNAAVVLDCLRSFVKDEGGTVVLATHDPRIHALADRILTLEDGRLVV